MARRAINPEGSFDPTDRAYTHAWVVDGTLYTSGQVGRDPDGEVAGADVEAQTRRAFENVANVLRAADRDLRDVAKVTTYLVDVHRDLPGFKAVWEEVFEAPYPAHTAIGVDALADPDLLVEVEVEAPR